MPAIKSVYERFLKGGNGGKRVEELWEDAGSFSVRRKNPEVDYSQRPTGSDDSGVFDSILQPPARGGQLRQERFAQRVIPQAHSNEPLDVWRGHSGGQPEASVSMSTPTRQIPPMPEIGRPESYYAQLAHCAERSGLTHHHEAAKVGQYITLALDHSLEWNQKLKYFQHALKRHCAAPPLPDDAVWVFYQDMRDLVRSYCGREALRIASIEDDIYATRQRLGQSRDKIEDDAERFFQNLMGLSDRCPDHFSEGDWAQLKLLRNQWI